MARTRKYEQTKRAERVRETRRRILEATVELHRTIGPAATRISEIAQRAGVERVTVYDHFPTETELLSACSAHWRGLHPAPNPADWLSITDPAALRRRALRNLYAWYRETESMTANVLRDADIMPSLRAIIDRGFGAYMREVIRTLADSVQASRDHSRRTNRGATQRQRIEAAVRASIDFHFWRALAALGDAEAAELGAGLMELAGRPAQRTTPTR